MTKGNATAEARHYFLVDDRDGHHLLFVNDAIMDGPRPFEPLWVGSCENVEARSALARWLMMRRERFEDWARLRAEVGQHGFEQHMASLLKAEPLESIIGTMLNRGADPRDLEIGEMLHGKHGIRTEVAARHRFGSNALRERFLLWIHADANIHLVHALGQMAWSEEKQELGEVLDDLARKAPPVRRSRQVPSERRPRRAA